MGLSTKQVIVLASTFSICALIYFSSKQLSTVENDLEEIKEIVAHNPKTFVKTEDEMYFENIENKGRQPAGSASAQEEFDRMWDYIYHMQYKCKESEYLGGKKEMLGDGAYYLCTEDRFWPVKRNPDYKCLMYSIGVGEKGGDFSFDDEVAKRGCEVHAFDPTTEIADGTVRESGVVFHKIGINGQDIDKDKNGWKMRTLKTLLKELGHQGRYLDYLKIDTDAPQGGFEDTLMQELLDTGMHSCVRQYAQEIHLQGPIVHPPKLARCRALYRQMTTLNKHGWRMYNTTDNVRWVQVSQHNMKFSQNNIRPGMVRSGGTILWENAFVNFDVKGPCIPK